MFKEEQQKKTAEINRILAQYLPKEEGFQGKIMEAMQYSVTAGGKRLRPMLLWEVYRMFGGTDEKVISTNGITAPIVKKDFVYDTSIAQ